MSGSKHDVKCPWCGSSNVSCDMTDIGVGEQQTGPYGCEDCHAYQMRSDEEPSTDFELHTRWREGEKKT